ncbi:MAG: sulfite exporter TauE/SafE family protein, partial [Gammaproteobacteria bacterium]|nr:sulfite exporter TauE/SafE family protein [Gammaproteobacteria bacterium]
GLVIAVGALVLLAVAMSVAGLKISPTRPTLITAGALSGFMSTVSSVGGPPLAITYQH